MTDVVEAPVHVVRKSGARRSTRPSRGPSAVILGALLAVTYLVIQLRWLMPPYPADQIHYMQAADEFPDRPPGPFEHQYLRYGMIVPMRLAIEAFGYSQAAYYAIPVLSGLLLAVSTYALGVLWFGRVVGLLSALLTIGNSAVFTILSSPLPDIPATACFVAAVALAVAVRQRRPWATASGPRRAAVLAAIGLMLTGSYLFREFAVALWPLVGLILVRRISRLEVAWLVAPIAALLALETLTNAVLADDPLARFHAASEHGSGPSRMAATYQDKSAWVYLGRFPMVLYQAPEGRWLLALLIATVVGGLAAIAAARSVRDSRVRRLALLLLWILLLWVPLTLLGGLLDPSQPKLRLQLTRYWFPVFPAVILGGIAVAWLAGHAAARRVPALRRRAGAAAFVAAVAAAVAALPPLVVAAHSRADDHRYRANGASQFEDLRSWLVDHQEVRVIWADWHTAKLLPIYTVGPFGGTAWDGEVPAMRGQDPVPTLARNERVVLYNTDRGQYCRPCRQAAWRVFGQPLTLPTGWTREYHTPDGVIQVWAAR